MEGNQYAYYKQLGITWENRSQTGRGVTHYWLRSIQLWTGWVGGARTHVVYTNTDGTIDIKSDDPDKWASVSPGFCLG